VGRSKTYANLFELKGKPSREKEQYEIYTWRNRSETIYWGGVTAEGMVKVLRCTGKEEAVVRGRLPIVEDQGGVIYLSGTKKILDFAGGGGQNNSPFENGK